MKRLSQLTPQYSSFVDDQILTSAKLNEFIEYFDEQDRLSRVCLSGVGITCGFKVVFNVAEPSITINQGCGITTDGDLIKLQQLIPEEEEDTKDSFKDIHKIVAAIKYTHFKPFLDEYAKYDRFRSKNEVINLIELVPDVNVSMDDEAIKLTAEQLKDKVVVIYLESYLENKTICTTTNCDNLGLPNIQNIKVVLIAKRDVEVIVNKNDTIFNKHSIYETIIALPRIAVERVVLKGDGKLTDPILSYKKMVNAYAKKITIAKEVLSEAYSNLFIDFSEILNISTSVKNVILNGITNLDKVLTDNFNNDDSFQYRYAFTKNISDNFNEIADLLLKLKTECCPDIDAFPKHILLGTLQATKEYPEFRHNFYPAPTNTEYETILKKVQSLVERVHLMFKNFNLNNTKSIKITPSLMLGKLGEKAIPAYFDVDESLLKYWDFEKTQNFKQKYNLSYHNALLAPNSWVQNPLNFELDWATFYRIEGHIGKTLQVADATISDLQKSNGLDFNYLIFDIGKNQNKLAEFVREHPSIAHKGGVEKGGTLILLTTTNTESIVIADFSISYKIATESTGIACCNVVECSYPWISSLKYLNNLSRSLRGDKSKIKINPTEYILIIMSYKINGQAIINSQRTLRIPLKNIFLNRMHAITSALNNEFPEGVVFDFDENQKRFIIIKGKEDTFSIRLKENSLNQKNAIYSYTNDGFYRENRLLRPDVMICRDLNGAKPSFYKTLHSQYDPAISKDDDYEAYDNKWNEFDDLVRSKDLKKHPLFTNKKLYGDFKAGAQHRFFKYKSDFTADAEIEPTNSGGTATTIKGAKTILEEIRSAFVKIRPEYKDKEGTTKYTDFDLYLDGDWVNGTWVDTHMVNYYQAHKDEKKDVLIRFMNLRALLHNKSVLKKTKFSIYIGNMTYDKTHQAIIDKYRYDADFYYRMPKGKTKIKIE